MDEEVLVKEAKSHVPEWIRASNANTSGDTEVIEEVTVAFGEPL